jgi:putative endonuclease
MADVGKFERLWIDAAEWGFGRLAWLSQRRRHALPAARHLAVGLSGERAAMFQLRRLGYVVVAQRWTSSRMRGDVDLIAWNLGRLCFVEVKTRTARDLHPAESAVDDDKRRMLRGLARAYLRSFAERERRTIPVGGTTEFQVFEDAFGWR